MGCPSIDVCHVVSLWTLTSAPVSFQAAYHLDSVVACTDTAGMYCLPSSWEIDGVLLRSVMCSCGANTNRGPPLASR